MAKKFETQNGWTKATMIEHIKANFKGQSITDGKDAFGTVPVCYYRHPSGDGRKCAVGLFIPDKNYKESMEFQSSLILFEENPSLKKLMPLESEGMRNLQFVHDRTNRDETILTTLNAMLKWIDNNVEDV